MLNRVKICLVWGLSVMFFLSGLWGTRLEALAAASDPIPVAYWKLDETEGSTAYDASGNSQNGTIINHAAWSAGIENGALTFDGVDDRLNLGAANFRISQEFTAAAWIYPSGPNFNRSYQVIVQAGRYVYPFLIQMSGQRIQTCIRTTAGTRYFLSFATLEYRQWYHVALTYRENEQVLYINGQEDSRRAVTGPLATTIQDVSSVGGGPTGSSPFNGMIDDAVIYNQALTSDDIAQVMAGMIHTRPATPTGLTARAISFQQIDLQWQAPETLLSSYQIYRDGAWVGNSDVAFYSDTGLSPATRYTYTVRAVDVNGNESADSAPASALTPVMDLSAGLAAHWKLDEEDGVVAADASGLGNPAALLNGPVWDAGNVMGSLRFDGVDDYLDAGNQAFGLTGDMTVAMWVKPAVILSRGTQVLIQRGRYIYPFMMRIESKKIRACIRTTSGTHYIFGQTVLAPDQWYHVALTFENGELILYVDGKEESRASVVGAMNVMANQKTTIGANPLGQNPFAGHLDDVRIYDRALAPMEIGHLAKMVLSPMAITQNGITWTLDRAYEFGQFANGDYWVVGPATIIAITNGYHVHGFTPVQGQDGSMINPGTDTRQGYDHSLTSYDAGLNASHPNGRPISFDNPLVLSTNQSLVSTVSWLYRSATDAEPGCPAFNGTTQTPRPVTRAAAVLTCLAAPATRGSFRPPYAGGDKAVRFNVSQLRSHLLMNLSTTGITSIPDVKTMEDAFARVWLDHVNDYLGSYVHPSENMDDYGREIAKKIGDAALLLNLNYSELAGNNTKDTLLMEFVQLGIDLAGIADNGGFWRPNGGFNQGRKWPILFAGLMLDDAHMQGVGTWPTLFQEDGNTFYVSQDDVDRTHSPQWNPDPRNNSQPYETSDIGLPEWGIRHATHPYQDDKDWNAVYRATTTCSYPGFVLAVHIMGQKQAWNHDALFDFVDRWMTITGGEQQMQKVTPFTKSMWNRYRSSYPPVWPH